MLGNCFRSLSNLIKLWLVSHIVLFTKLDYLEYPCLKWYEINANIWPVLMLRFKTNCWVISRPISDQGIKYSTIVFLILSRFYFPCLTLCTVLTDFRNVLLVQKYLMDSAQKESFCPGRNVAFQLYRIGHLYVRCYQHQSQDLISLLVSSWLVVITSPI